MGGKGIIIIISGPSGAGEDSIIDGLAKHMPIERVVTTTTRSPRDGESEGNPYYFISNEEFEKGIKEDKFFEYAKQYNDNYYGVTYNEIERVKQAEGVGIWKIEYKGVMEAKKKLPGIPAIYINAPLNILEQRIRGRKGVTDEYVAERMAYTKEWLKHLDIYDYQVENEQGKLGDTIQKVKNIIEKELNK
jgi:guanylate kinase